MAYELFYGQAFRGAANSCALRSRRPARLTSTSRASAGRAGVKALMAMLEGGAAQTPFAPPFLRDGDVVVSHVANILHYLGPKIGLAPAGEPSRVFAHGLQLTITDLVSEAPRHTSPDFDRPLLRGPKEGGQGARRRFPRPSRPEISRLFRARAGRQSGGKKRMPSAAGSRPWTCRCSSLGGAELRLSARLRRRRGALSRLSALAASVAARPNVAAYLASERRIPFNSLAFFGATRTSTRPRQRQEAAVVTGSDGVGKRFRRDFLYGQPPVRRGEFRGGS